MCLGVSFSGSFLHWPCAGEEPGAAQAGFSAGTCGLLCSGHMDCWTAAAGPSLAVVRLRHKFRLPSVTVNLSYVPCAGGQGLAATYPDAIPVSSDAAAVSAARMRETLLAVSAEKAREAVGLSVAAARAPSQQAAAPRAQAARPPAAKRHPGLPANPDSMLDRLAPAAPWMVPIMDTGSSPSVGEPSGGTPADLQGMLRVLAKDLKAGHAKHNRDASLDVADVLSVLRPLERAAEQLADWRQGDPLLLNIAQTALDDACGNTVDLESPGGRPGCSQDNKRRGDATLCRAIGREFKSFTWNLVFVAKKVPPRQRCPGAPAACKRRAWSGCDIGP